MIRRAICMYASKSVEKSCYSSKRSPMLTEKIKIYMLACIIVQNALKTYPYSLSHQREFSGGRQCSKTSICLPPKDSLWMN